jgi:predicted transcriptional regulator
MGGDVEPIAFLAGSKTRVRLLATLCEDGALSRTELRKRLDAARTTVTRNLTALAERGWVRESEGRCAVTPSGRLIADALDQAAATAAAAERLEPFFRWFPEEDPPLDPSAFADASVRVADPADPYAMINEHVNTLRRAERFRAALPLIGLHGFETVHERVVEEGAIHEIVVTPTVAETLRENADYADLFADLRECENFDAYVCDDEIPFYVGLIDDDGVEIGVDEDGTPRALLSSETPTVREWAEDVYERYRSAARPIG